MGGATKHCTFGSCNADSRLGRPGYRENVRFFRFPKPCLDFRKTTVSRYNRKPNRSGIVISDPLPYIRQHVEECEPCKLCQKWVVKCRRSDARFSSIADISRNSYVCSQHFPSDITEVDYAVHFPGDQMKPRRVIDRNVDNETSTSSSFQDRAPSNVSHEYEGYEDLLLNAGGQRFDDDPTVLHAPGIRDQSTQTNPRDIQNEDEAFESRHPTTKSRASQTDLVLYDLNFLREKNRELSSEIKKLVDEIKKLESELEQPKLDEFVAHVQEDDDVCKFYLGFTFDQLQLIMSFLDLKEVEYWNSSTKGSKKKLNYLEEFFLWLLRFRFGMATKDIAYRFTLSTGLISETVSTWTQLLYHKFLPYKERMFTPQSKIRETLPKRFETTKNIRVIIDCAEIFCQRPSDFSQQSNLYSFYKAHTTFKFLIGCTPNGVISFVSEVVEGSMSDRDLFKNSGMLKLLEEGDMVMADRGFTIKDLLDEIKVELNIPAFLAGRDRLTPQEEIATKNIAKNRIIVENVVRRLKEFRFFSKVQPLTMRSSLSQVVFVCACLFNFNPPMVE